MENEKKNKHLTLEDRLEIQEYLSHGMTFKAIGKRIGKDQTTVSKEVKRNIVIKPTAVVKTDKNGVVIANPCPLLLKSPFVCNPCKRCNYQCSHDKSVYIARQAQKKYEETLVSAREGIPLNKESFYEIDKVVSSGIKNGQHLYHIIHTNNLDVSESTVYRHLKIGYYSISAIDFPRVVKFKPRTYKKPYYVPKGIKLSRTYKDFEEYARNNPSLPVVEMDTVIGSVGGKVIMTFIFISCNFMFGLLMDDKSALSGAKAISTLKEKLSANNFSFGSIFPILLTDNGGEFANVFAFETDQYNARESRVFFCDPFTSCQKPHVEKNHTLFRDIVPKGSSFNSFTQDTVNLIFSHVNGIKRKELNGKSPFDVFEFLYSKELAAVLGIHFVPADEVIQSSALLHKKK